MNRLGMPSPEEQRAEALRKAEGRIRRGDFEEEVLHQMARDGVPVHEAKALIAPVLAERDLYFRKRGIRDLVIGGVLGVVFVGLILFSTAEIQSHTTGRMRTRGGPVRLIILSGVAALFFCSRGTARVVMGGGGESMSEH